METIQAGLTAEKTAVIILPTSKGIILVAADEIIRIQSISNYSKLFFKNGKTLVVAKLLRWFEEQTSLKSFIRIHRTHFVNINFISSYDLRRNGMLSLINGESFIIARRKKAALKGRLVDLPQFPLAQFPAPINTNKHFAA